MNRFLGIMFGLLTLAPFVAVAFFLYAKIPSTPMLILILIILLAGVMVSYYVYTKRLNPSKKTAITKIENFPFTENDLLMVNPDEFAEKSDKITGNLFLTAWGYEQGISLVESKYDKLTDELSLKYTKGIKTIIKGAGKIGVGYNQFLFYKFDQLILIRNRKKIIFQLERNKIHIKDGKESKIFKIPGKLPLYVFDWKAKNDFS